MPNPPTQSLFAPGRQSTWPIFPQTGIPALMQDPQTGAIYQNPLKNRQKWIWLCSNPNIEVALPVGDVVNVALTAQLEEGTLGDVELVKLISYQTAVTGRFAARLYDTFLDRWLSNGPVDVDLMFGTPEYPGTLYESIFIPASTSLVIQLTNLGSVAIDVNLTGQGRRFMGCAPRELIWNAFRSRRTHPYWLTFDQGAQVSVPAVSTRTYTMTVPAGGDFDAWLLMDDTVQSGTDTPAEYLIRILEGQSGRSLIGTATPVGVPISVIAAKSRNVTGVNGGRMRAVGNPNALTFTHLFAAKTQVQIEIENEGDSAISVRLAFHGQMIYADQCPPNGGNGRMLEEPVGFMPVPQPCATPGQACLPGVQGQQSFTAFPGTPQYSAPPRPPAPAYSPPVVGNNGLPLRPILGAGYGAGLQYGLGGR